MPKFRFFHGWLIVAITFLTSMLNAGISGYGLAFFIRPMSESLAVSRGAFSSITLFRLVLMPIVPFLGPLVDKKNGAKALIISGSIIGGLTLIATSNVTELWEFFILFGIIFGLANTLMGGQIVEPAVLSKWFIKKRGRAMAIGTMGISAGGFIIGPIVGWLLSNYSWETAWVILGLSVIIFITPPTFLFMQRQPEDIGLLPDGDLQGDSEAENTSKSTATHDISFTLKEVVKQQQFWIIMGVSAFGMGGLFPVIMHQVAYIQDKGFTLTTTTTIATTVAFFAMIGKIPWGILAEKFNPAILTSICAISAGFSLFLLIFGQSLTILYTYALFMGITMGGFPTLINIVLPMYFGRDHMGAIRGVMVPITQVFAAISPVIGGFVWDYFGSYDIAFALFASFWIISGILMILSTKIKTIINQ